MNYIKRKLQSYFQSIDKLCRKSISAILFAINLSIYKADHFFIYKTLQIKKYKKYIPIFLGLLIFLLIFFYRIELFNILSADNSFKALGSLTLALGSALVGVTAIAFMLIVFSLQVNIERLPYGLFHTLGSDKKLMSLLETTFSLAILIACLSLIQNSDYAVVIFLVLLESTFIIFFLLYFTYERALKLINPYEQLMLIIEKTDINLKWWNKRFKRTEPIMKNSNVDDNFDWKKDNFFMLNPNYFYEVKNALNFIDSITQRHLNKGDYIVSEMALNTFVSINQLYIKAKKKTFFSYSPLLDTGLWDDEIINKTLEYIRLNFAINLKKSDERALNLLLSCYVKLVKLYTSIEYRTETNSKVHANLASQYLIGDVEKLIQLKNSDLLMNGIRNIEEIINFYIKYGLLTDTVTMVESIGRIGLITELDKIQTPVVQTAMNAFSNITKNLLVSKNNSISFVLETVNEQINMLVKAILQYSTGYNCEHSLGTYFSYNNNSLMHYLTDLANALLEQESIGKDEKKILDNIVIYADKSYRLNKELFLLALEKQSLSINNFLAWIEQFAYLSLILSTLEYSKRTELEKYAIWFLSIISFIPQKKEAVKYAEIFNLTETLFDAGNKYIRQNLLSGAPTIIHLLVNWSFEIGKYDDENKHKATLGLLGSSYLTLICKCEYKSEKLLKQIEDNMEKYTLSDETIAYICKMLDNVITGEMNNYGSSSSSIENTIMQYDNSDINNLLEKIKFIIQKKNGDEETLN